MRFPQGDGGILGRSLDIAFPRGTMQAMTTRRLSVMLGVLACVLLVAGVWGYFRADQPELVLVSPSSGSVANSFSVGENTFEVVLRNNSGEPIPIVGFGEC